MGGKEESCTVEEKTSTLLAKKIGVLPEEIECVGKLLKTSREMLHFYLNEFGLHLEKEQQNELSKLSNKSDVLSLKTARLSFELRTFGIEAKKSIETKKEFEPDKKEASALSKEVNETKKEITELNKRITVIVEEMKELPRDD